MRLLRPLLLGFILALAWTGAAAGEPYGWTISASQATPDANTGGLIPGGLGHLYLWLACCNVPDYPGGTPRQQGFTTVRFRLDITGMLLVGLTTSCNSLPWLFPPDYWLVCPGCACGPVVVGEVTVIWFGDPGASICFAPNSVSGDLVTLDCESEPTAWGMDWIGFRVDAPPCSSGPLCQAPVSTDAPGWGRVKSLYR